MGKPKLKRMAEYPACTNETVRQVLRAQPDCLTPERINYALEYTLSDAFKSISTPPLPASFTRASAASAAFKKGETLEALAHLQLYYLEKGKQ